MSVAAARGVAASTGGGDGARPQRPASMLSGCSVVVGRILSSVVVTLRGSLNAASSPDVAGVLHDLINGQGNLALVLDLRGLRELDHCGVEVLSAAASDIERRGGGLRLGGAEDEIQDALVAVGITPLVARPKSVTAMSTTRRGCDVRLGTGPTLNPPGVAGIAVHRETFDDPA